jgi:hypothetical protein
MLSFAFPVGTLVISDFQMKNHQSSKKAAKKKSVADIGKPKGLSEEEAQELDLLDGVIERGMATFDEMGAALTTVQEKKLYREFGTFEDRVEKKYGMTRQRAYQYMKAAKAMRELEEMSTIVDISQLPENEAQVRPLLRLKKSKDRAQAWKNAQDACPGGKPVASNVKEAVEALLKEKGEIPPKPKREPAVLADEKEISDALWPEGYVNSEVAQRELDKIKEDSSVPESVKVKVQKVFLEITKTLNRAAEDDESGDMKEGLDFLARNIIRFQQQDDDQLPGLSSLKPAA